MIKKFYYHFHRLTSRAEERGECSAGYWQGLIRSEALILCRGVSGRLLEIGCGEGLFLIQLAKENPSLEICGIDNDPVILYKAEKKIKDRDFKNIDLLLGDATNLPFNDEYFDAVICINVFLNLPSVDSVRQALSQIKRVCKKRGKIVFEFRNSTNPLVRAKFRLAPYYDSTVQITSLNTYNPREIEGILKDLNLGIIKKRAIGFPFKRFAPIIIIEAEKVC